MEKDYICPWPGPYQKGIYVMRYESCQPVQPHIHDFIEIVFFVYGTCKHNYKNMTVTLIPGDTFIVIPHEEHSYEIDSDTVVYNCLFYPDVLGNDREMVMQMGGIFDMLMAEPFYRSESSGHEILHLEPQQLTYVETIIKNMLNEQELQRPDSYLAMKANLLLLLVFLGRVWEKQFKNTRNTLDIKREMLVHAISYIDKNFSKDIKIEDLASKVYLSANYFRKVFKEVTGLTPLEYINKLRIAKAQKLLTTTNYPISYISELIGVSDVNYFSRLFHSMIGLAPSEYRKNGVNGYQKTILKTN